MSNDTCPRCSRIGWTATEAPDERSCIYCGHVVYDTVPLPRTIQIEGALRLLDAHTGDDWPKNWGTTPESEVPL